MSRKKTLLICSVIVLVGIAATTLIFTTEPVAEQSGATKQTAMLVEVDTVQRGNFRPVIKATGTVRPSKDIMLSPRVSGEIIDLEPVFTPGGFVEQGQVLVQIDPSDYEIDLQQQKSVLRQIEADLQIEMGLQEVAQNEYQLLEDTLDKKNRALLLREPQLNAIRAEVEAARANVRQAELDLNRTKIRAPFKAHIVNRNVSVGSQVAPGDDLGWLVGVEEYWIEASIPVSNVRWLTFSDDNSGNGSSVRLRNRTAWEDGVYREGELFRLIGALQTQTRMARILISVNDPLAQQPENENSPRLMIGAFVETYIEGKELSNVIRLDRDYIRSNRTAWIMEDDTLRIRNVDIIFQDAEYAYIQSGLNDGDRIVTTNLSTVVDGAGLRTQQSDSLQNAE